MEIRKTWAVLFAAAIFGINSHARVPGLTQHGCRHCRVDNSSNRIHTDFLQQFDEPGF